MYRILKLGREGVLLERSFRPEISKAAQAVGSAHRHPAVTKQLMLSIRGGVKKFGDGFLQHANKGQHKAASIVTGSNTLRKSVCQQA